MKTKRALLSAVISACFLLQGSAFALDEPQTQTKPLVLNQLGGLAFDGTVSHKPNGLTFHGDHGYAQYVIPVNAKNYPIILWHGIGQSGRSFETTPDGREGFQTLLPRDGWATYIVDQPRRGRAGRTEATDVKNEIPTVASEAGVWNAFRLGRWVPPKPATANPNMQMPLDGETINQFMRMQTPDTRALPPTEAYGWKLGKTMRDLLKRTGPAIVGTHSYAGQIGWYGAMTSPDLVKAVVAYEPGQVVYPVGEKVKEMNSEVPLVQKALNPVRVSKEEFMKLTKMPILIIFGDNIATKPSTVFNEEVWRWALFNARQFVDLINKYGGDAKLIHLPEIGIKGNTHALFSDLNNKEILKITEGWLAEKGLDKNDAPHLAPKRPVSPVTIPLEK